jgi:hypothetical protein
VGGRPARDASGAVYCVAPMGGPAAASFGGVAGAYAASCNRRIGEAETEALRFGNLTVRYLPSWSHVYQNNLFFNQQGRRASQANLASRVEAAEARAERDTWALLECLAR